MCTSRRRADGTYTASADDTVLPVKRGEAVVFTAENVLEVI